ncbi:MAG: hypothetical protein O3B24_11450, partial [Verrucomicrobia bacterium]|nr:hypothetical protein [Verrucomicrobiota bacterium]
RGVMLASTPVLEDDYWRYLWDGAVVAHGQNPYAHAPQSFLAANESPEVSLSAFDPLVRDGHSVLERINHPSLRTIYPPLAQAAFALAHLLAPWSVTAWRLVLIGFDTATLALLVCLLRELRRPPLWAAIYWWNPLLIQQSVNAAHMDVLALPFVLGALLLALRGKSVRGIALMSLAVGVKVWPVVLLPFLFRPLSATPRRFAAGAMVAVPILALVTWPAVQGFLNPASGFAAYAERWEMNDALFMALLYGIRLLLGWVGSPEFASPIARLVCTGLLGLWVGWLAWRPAASTIDLPERMLLAIAMVFLLSPAQFPWYSIWMLPFLALRPRLSLMLLFVLLSLYGLRFHFDARDRVAIFDHGIVWLEYVPVWGLLAWEAIRRHRAERPAPLASGDPGTEWRPA